MQRVYRDNGTVWVQSVCDPKIVGEVMECLEKSDHGRKGAGIVGSSLGLKDTDILQLRHLPSWFPVAELYASSGDGGRWETKRQ